MIDRPNRRFATVGETAQYLRLSEHGCRKLIYAGKIPAIRVGRAVRVDLRELDRQLEDQLKESSQL